MTGDPLWEGGEDGATLLSPEDLHDLLPKGITFRHELNEAEASGVSRAVLWALERRWPQSTLLDPAFISNLHKRMLGEVWAWAGSYRTRETNIGVAPREIPVEIYKLRGDAEYWLKNGAFSPDEIAVRYHHRLAFIHPFPNGNGRLSRLMGDLLSLSLEQARFTWGRASLQEKARLRYIEAMRAADKEDFVALMELSRVP